MREQHTEAALRERRSDERVFEKRPMTLSIEATAFDGHSRDTSDSSVFFLSEDELRLAVRFTDDEGVEQRGHLVRYQRMPSGGSGWAIEFDD